MHSRDLISTTPLDDQDVSCHEHCFPRGKPGKNKCDVLTLVNANVKKKDYIILKFSKKEK